MAEHLPQIRNIAHHPDVAGTPAFFDTRTGPSQEAPITVRFPDLPNIRFELVSPIWELNPIDNTAIPPGGIQPSRWYTEPAVSGTWCLGPSRQMHQDYDVRSWHRVSSSIARSESLITRDGWETQTISSAFNYSNGNAVQTSEEETPTSQPANSLGLGLGQAKKKERRRDRIRRFGMSIVKRFGKFGSNKRIHRAFSIFGFKSAGGQSA